MAKKVFLVVLSTVLVLISLSSCSILSLNRIVTVESIEWHSFDVRGNGVAVNLKPSDGAKADVEYTVDLYESGRYRDTQSISWDANELQTYTLKTLVYYLPDSEFEAYEGTGKNPSDVFSVKVHESVQESIATSDPALINQNKKASLTLTYPKGGEIWHVGQTVNITWTSTNLNKDASIFISISNDSGNTLLPLVGQYGIQNTGNFQWIVTSSYVHPTGYGNAAPNINTSYIGNHIRIEVDFNSSFTTIKGSLSATDFTITK